MVFSFMLLTQACSAFLMRAFLHSSLTLIMTPESIYTPFQVASITNGQMGLSIELNTSEIFSQTVRIVFGGCGLMLISTEM